MDLIKLFESQKELDGHIAKNMELDNKSLVNKKITALRVELFELLNELPEEFKFWSHKKNNPVNALKEYVDILHFALSIGNDLKMGERTKISKTYKLLKEKSISEMIHKLDVEAIALKGSYIYYKNSGKQYFDYESYYRLFNLLFGLGEMLGFTWEQIEEAYYKKNQINHERQDNGY